MKSTNQRGFAMVEASVALTLVMLAATLGLAVLYASFAKIWLDRSAYEASVCLATLSAPSDCERRLRDDIRRALPIGFASQLHLGRSSMQTNVSFDWSLGTLLKLKIHDERRLPLIASLGEN